MKDWRGPIAFVLAIGVAVTLVAGIVTAELTPGPVTTQEVSLLSTIAGAIVGAVAAYLGIQSNNNRRSNSMETQTPEPEPETGHDDAEDVPGETPPDEGDPNVEHETPDDPNYQPDESPDPLYKPDPEHDERPDEEREATEEEADAGDITQGMGPGEESD